MVVSTARYRALQGPSLLESAMTDKRLIPVVSRLVKDLSGLIETTRWQVARAVDTGLVLHNWKIGRRLRQDVIAGPRASYGEQIVSTVSRQLVERYGPGYSHRNLLHMLRFADAFTDERIVSTLSRYLGWSHFKEVIYLDDRLKRDFYAEMCRVENWSVRTLRLKSAACCLSVPLFRESPPN